MSLLTAYNKFVQQALKYGFSLFGTAKTGQTTQYYSTDDAYFKKGYPQSSPRFVDNGDGTITDHASGLMWVKDPGAIGGVWGSAGEPTAMSWTQALDYIMGLNYAGHTLWRLPNVKELLSIVDHGHGSPAIDENLFVSRNDDYWSSTTYFSLTTHAWAVNFNVGNSHNVDKTLDEEIYARPVRLGVPPA